MIGSILDAARTRYAQPVVSDPFSGGGTVAIEAAKRGLPLYAQDLNPWAAWGLAVTLDGSAPEEIETATQLFRERAGSVSHRYGSVCPDHGRSQVVTTFRVREFACTDCGNEISHFPYSLITLLSRTPTERDAYFGCHVCGEVSLQAASGRDAICPSCIERLPAPREPLSSKTAGIPCPHCGHTIPHDDAWATTLRWRPVLIQRLCRDGDESFTHFDIPTDAEVRRANRPSARIPEGLRAPIPAGDETRRLRVAGFAQWSDLYPGRQLDSLLDAGAVMQGLEIPRRTKARLMLALVGAAEMAGYLCRWDRFHPKVFEGLANHRFSLTGMPVEINPLADVGRGTLWRRLGASATAAGAARGLAVAEFIEGRGRTRTKNLSGSDVVIARGSSEHQSLRRGTATLILTDPPYFDSVQYGELSQIFHAWMRAVKAPARVDFEPEQEALPNRARGANTHDYEMILRRIFRESAKTLSKDGTVILTFRSSTLRAWWALGSALDHAGLQVRAVALVKSENDNDHSKRGKNSITRDLVIECGPGSGTRPIAVVTPPKNPEERELIAAGRAAFGVAANYASTRERFLGMTRRMRSRRIEFPEPVEIQDKGGSTRGGD